MSYFFTFTPLPVVGTIPVGINAASFKKPSWIFSQLVFELPGGSFVTRSMILASVALPLSCL